MPLHSRAVGPDKSRMAIFWLAIYSLFQPGRANYVIKYTHHINNLPRISRPSYGTDSSTSSLELVSNNSGIFFFNSFLRSIFCIIQDKYLGWNKSNQIWTSDNRTWSILKHTLENLDISTLYRCTVSMYLDKIQDRVECITGMYPQGRPVRPRSHHRRCRI